MCNRPNGGGFKLTLKLNRINGMSQSIDEGVRFSRRKLKPNLRLLPLKWIPIPVLHYASRKLFWKGLRFATPKKIVALAPRLALNAYRALPVGP